MNTYTKHNSTYYDLRKGFRKNPTKAEDVLWQKLRRGSLDAKFRRQTSVGRYIVDFMSVRPMIIIEVDGSVHDEVNQANKDRERDEILTAMGYRVLRFRNEEVLYQMPSVLERIRKHIADKRQKSSPQAWGGQPRTT